MPYTRIVENLVLTETLRIEGPDWDDTLIRNVTIENVRGDGIVLRDVDNVRIERVTIRDVTGDGIKLSTRGSTSDVVIEDSLITRTGEDGINAGQRRSVDHPGLQILGNTIDRTGLSGGDTGLMHGIYVQSTDFLIQGNLITASIDGNGISARSSGEIRGNFIDGAFKSGIAYFADNAKGDSDRLVIAGNVVVNAGIGTDRSGIDLLEVPDARNVVSEIVLSDNTLASADLPAIAVASDYVGLAAQVNESGNRSLGEDEVRDRFDASSYGGRGSAIDLAPAPGPRPGGGQFPDFEDPGNMRLTLSDGGWGQTEVMLSRGETNLEAFTVDPGQELRRAEIKDMEMRISAFSSEAQARLGVDGGLLSVASGSGGPSGGISGDETLVFELGRGPVGDVGQVIIGLDGGSTGETVLVELLDDGRLLGTFTSRADAVVDIEVARAFDEVRLAAGTGDGFSLAWIEFGSVDPVRASFAAPREADGPSMLEGASSSGPAPIAARSAAVEFHGPGPIGSSAAPGKTLSRDTPASGVGPLIDEFDFGPAQGEPSIFGPAAGPGPERRPANLSDLPVDGASPPAVDTAAWASSFAEAQGDGLLPY